MRRRSTVQWNSDTVAFSRRPTGRIVPELLEVSGFTEWIYLRSCVSIVLHCMASSPANVAVTTTKSALGLSFPITYTKPFQPVALFTASLDFVLKKMTGHPHNCTGKKLCTIYTQP